MTRLARWYDVEVFFAVPDLKNARFTLNLERYDNIIKYCRRLKKRDVCISVFRGSVLLWNNKNSGV